MKALINLIGPIIIVIILAIITGIGILFIPTIIKQRKRIEKALFV